VDPSTQKDRQNVSMAHLAMVAALFSYAVLIWLLKDKLASSPQPEPPRGDALALPLFAIGVVQYLLATHLGARRLPGPPAAASARVRSYFLIRFASAEALGIFGLFVGFLGARTAVWAALLATSLVAMLASAPTREAWEAALRRATPSAGT
jgi:hypothetical protein